MPKISKRDLKWLKKLAARELQNWYYSNLCTDELKRRYEKKQKRLEKC